MAKHNGGDVREIEASLEKDFEREGGYRTPKEPQLLRREGTLIMAMADSQRIDAENITLKARVRELEKMNRTLSASNATLRAELRTARTMLGGGR